MPEHHTHSDMHEAHRRLIGRLRQQANDVTRIAAGLDEASLAKRTIPDKWSLKELVCHLHRVQQVFEGRIASMLAQDNPAITVYSPDDDAEFEKMLSRPAKDALVAFLEDRERLAAQWEELSPGEWHGSGRHPEYPHYDVRFQVEYMVHHEAHHIYQMFQRRTPFGKMPH
jgi:Mycothiol maleylpyruvate isomerase N-terminal domain